MPGWHTKASCALFSLLLFSFIGHTCIGVVLLLGLRTRFLDRAAFVRLLGGTGPHVTRTRRESEGNQQSDLVPSQGIRNRSKLLEFGESYWKAERRENKERLDIRVQTALTKL